MSNTNDNNMNQSYPAYARANASLWYLSKTGETEYNAADVAVPAPARANASFPVQAVVQHSAPPSRAPSSSWSAFGGNSRGRGGAGYKHTGYQRPAPIHAMPRKADDKPKTVDLTSEMNFPSLGGGDGWNSKPSVSSAQPAGKTFAELATGWKESEDAEKQLKLVEQDKAKYVEVESSSRYCMASHIMTTTRSRLNTAKYSESEEEETEDRADERPLEDEWQPVEKKKLSYQPTVYVNRESRWEDEDGEGDDDDDAY